VSGEQGRKIGMHVRCAAVGKLRRGILVQLYAGGRPTVQQGPAAASVNIGAISASLAATAGRL